MKTLKIISLVIPVICVCSCGLRESGRPAGESAEVTVRVREAGFSEDKGATTYMGSVQSAKNTVLTAPAPGNLQHLNVRQGRKVRKGEVLAVISSESVNSALEIASATLAQAEDGYDRLMKLYGKGGVTEVKKMEVETQLRTARATRTAALKAKENCTIRAPFSGTVEELVAHEGEELGLLSPILKLSDTDHVEIHFNVPEKEIGELKPGETVEVEIPALGDTLRLPLGLVNDSGNLLSHSYDCIIYPGEKISGLRPGMVIKVHRERNRTGNRLAVPVSAVFTGLEGRYVWIVEDGVVQKRDIVPGGYTEDGIVVSEGLREGDLVIVEGARKVCSGMKVRTER
ncbi:MAG: efflux RND transporter periplasmic adaptor subunit [Bacteroidales bacterium]|nr:efflux RND transporter periplasmic adaptor subunit [Bacteroidales bacterium]